MTDWEPDYDPMGSMKACLNEAASAFEKITNKTTSSTEVEVFVGVARMWISSAQVHATNANTMALQTNSAPKKTCRCR